MKKNTVLQLNDIVLLFLKWLTSLLLLAKNAKNTEETDAGRVGNKRIRVASGCAHFKNSDTTIMELQH